MKDSEFLVMPGITVLEEMTNGIVCASSLNLDSLDKFHVMYVQCVRETGDSQCRLT